MTLNSFSPYKSMRDQIWTCRKIGQGEPRVIIWTNYDRPKASMLHTKPQGHWPFGSVEENFWRVFTIYERCGHLGHVTQTLRTNFRSPTLLRLHMKFGFDWPSFGEDLWKWWTMDRRTDDGPWLYYKLTNEPKGSGEPKMDVKTKRSKVELSTHGSLIIHPTFQRAVCKGQWWSLSLPGWKKLRKSLKFCSFLPRFQALPLETFDHNVRKYSPTTYFSTLIEVTVIRDADKANQDKIAVHLFCIYSSCDRKYQIITTADSL